MTDDSLTRRFVTNAFKVLGETGIPVAQCNNLQVSSYAPLQDSMLRTV